jgi:DNA-binding NtrC family response regulator
VVIWTEGERVTRDDVEESIILLENKTSDNIMGRSLEKGFCLQDTMGEVAGHYIAEALRTTKGNKTKAANMLGLPNYQTLNNWIKKYGVRQEIES